MTAAEQNVKRLLTFGGQGPRKLSQAAALRPPRRPPIDATGSSTIALSGFFHDDALVELTAVIAWDNASSKFNRTLRVPSQELWRRSKDL